MLPLELLDRHDAVEPRVASLPHLSHPACAKRREDLIGTESFTNRERHGQHLV